MSLRRLAGAERAVLTDPLCEVELGVDGPADLVVLGLDPLEVRSGRLQADAQPARGGIQLRFAAVLAARTLLSFAGNVEVVLPAEVRADLASAAAEVVAQYSNTRLGMG